jgi:hypothetical protein
MIVSSFGGQHITSDVQFGSRPGRHCPSAVLKKVLCHEHIRIQKTTGAFIENDATGCYDRLMNNLLLMILKKLGLPSSVTTCIGTLWDTAIHDIKTVYGVSDTMYGSTADKPLYGPGQGSMCGPLFWLLIYWLISESIDPTMTAMTFLQHVRKSLSNSLESRLSMTQA